MIREWKIGLLYINHLKLMLQLELIFSNLQNKRFTLNIIQILYLPIWRR